jgi:hypothetical protein
MVDLEAGGRRDRPLGMERDTGASAQQHWDIIGAVADRHHLTRDQISLGAKRP